jgi:RimJ/RimL family protein N-acetyltransferase
MTTLPRPRPSPTVLEGRYTRLEPLTLSHAAGLYKASCEAQRFDYLPDPPPASVAEVQAWIERTLKNSEYLFSAVVDRATGEAAGRQALMRIEPAHGVIEIGNILWGPAISRTRISTEAFFLAARHVFDELGYRRFEWKCNDRNEPSKAAALRFGFTFEGLFRQHMVIKGENRDTAWFSIIDREWPEIRKAFERWLDPANFDSAGRQNAKLAASRT